MYLGERGAHYVYVALTLDAGDYLSENDISHDLPSLTTLRLNLQLSNYPQYHPAHLKWLPNFLGRFSCNKHLQVIEIFSVVLDILLTPKRHPNILPVLDQLWSTLDQTLPPGVNRFAIYRFNDGQPPNSDDEEWYVKEMERLLPLQASKGVLRHYPDGNGDLDMFQTPEN